MLQVALIMPHPGQKTLPCYNVSQRHIGTHTPMKPPDLAPIVGEARSLTTYTGDIISDVIELLAKVKEQSLEAQSTEEVHKFIKDASAIALEQGTQDLMTAFMDVVTLYPSLDQKASVREVADKFMSSNLEVKGVNYRAAVVYIAVNC